jgi:hypothetical protein
MKRALVATLAILLAAASARADAYDAALSHAIAAKEKALDSNAPSDWEDALAAMQAADAIRATAEVRYELAGIAARLHADDLAFEAYESALALGLTGAPAQKASAFLEARRHLVGRVRVRGPNGAHVLVLGRERAILPRDTPIIVFAGEVRIAARIGDQTVARSVRVDAGQTLDLDLSPAPPPPVVTASSLPPPAAPSTSYGPPLVVAGATTFGLGLVSVAAASIAIPHHREAIESQCPPQKLDGDRCLAAPADRIDSLSHHRSALLTWSAVRTGGMVAMGVGALVGAIGAVRWFGVESSRTTGMSPFVRSSATAWCIGLEGLF